MNGTNGDGPMSNCTSIVGLIMMALVEPAWLKAADERVETSLPCWRNIAMPVIPAPSQKRHWN